MLQHNSQIGMESMNGIDSIVPENITSQFNLNRSFNTVKRNREESSGAGDNGAERRDKSSRKNATTERRTKKKDSDEDESPPHIPPIEQFDASSFTSNSYNPPDAIAIETKNQSNGHSTGETPTLSESDGSNNRQMPLQWVCEHCERAVFDTYREACDHEKVCPDAPQQKDALSDRDGNSKELASNNNNVNKIADNIKSNTCIDKTSKPEGDKIQWVCEFCETAVFDTYQEACAHESNCNYAPNPSNSKSDSAPLENSSTRTEIKENEVNKLNTDQQQISDKLSNANDIVKKEILQWVCVYCEKAVFPTYQEACEHESSCPEAPGNA